MTSGIRRFLKVALAVFLVNVVCIVIYLNSREEADVPGADRVPMPFDRAVVPQGDHHGNPNSEKLLAQRPGGDGKVGDARVGKDPQSHVLARGEQAANPAAVVHIGAAQEVHLANSNVHILAKQQMKENSLRKERGVSNGRGEYVDTLLLKPRQDHDFHHKSATAVFRSNAGMGDVWPVTETVTNNEDDDRILGQMRYKVPTSGQKLLVVMTGETPESSRLHDDQCPVTACDITHDRSLVTKADALLWQHNIARPSHKRPPGQIWIAFFLESPFHTPSLASLGASFNWTATYRRDSTIVAPYERFTSFREDVAVGNRTRDYSKGKTKMVAWFVSNCGAGNNRMGYAKELGRHVPVDIYGSCGSLKCRRGSGSSCFDMLSRDYKFYLSFENSNCQDYITEKFFLNGLMNDVVPIVMGAHPDEYRRAAPPHSFIHVDDFESPHELAAYLRQLDENPALYNAYFAWKGTASTLNTYFWCRVCMMMHEADHRPPRNIPDINKWWRGSGVCITRRPVGMFGGQELWPRWRSAPTKVPKE